MRIENNKKFVKGEEYIIKGRNGIQRVKIVKDFEYKEPGDLVEVKVLDGDEKGTKKKVDLRQIFMAKADGNTNFA